MPKHEDVDDATAAHEEGLEDEPGDEPTVSDDPYAHLPVTPAPNLYAGDEPGDVEPSDDA